eukprot:scaffold2709_cov122-Isochrysis_galbana.AAC.4
MRGMGTCVTCPSRTPGHRNWPPVKSHTAAPLPKKERSAAEVTGPPDVVKRRHALGSKSYLWGGGRRLGSAVENGSGAASGESAMGWPSLRAGDHVIHGSELSCRQLILQRRDQRLHQPLAIFSHSSEHASRLGARREYGRAIRVTEARRAGVQQDAHAAPTLHLLDAQRVEPGPLHRHSHELLLAAQTPRNITLQTRPFVTEVVARYFGRLTALHSNL